MNYTDLALYRLQNQKLLNSDLTTPTEVVKWLLAVQSQDFVGAKWTVGLRAPSLTDEIVEKAFNEGEILRTHVMRPTWHFVSPDDIQWLLKLTAPRVKQLMSYYNRKLGLTEKIFDQATEVISSALANHNYLTRQELKQELEQAGIKIKTENKVQYLAHLLLWPELNGVICSGPRLGKQFTYALLSERTSKPLTRFDKDEALAELATRYFKSHGPATVKDCSWWSGLTVAEVKRGIELASLLESEDVSGKTYWFAKSQPKLKQNTHSQFMLSNYDEFTIAYKDLEVFVDSAFAKKVGIVFAHAFLVDGRIIGMWKRVIQKNTMNITVRLFKAPSQGVKHALEKACNHYSAFLGQKINLTTVLD